MFQPIYHVSVSLTDGNGPTQGQRKTLTRVGFEPTTFEFDHRCSTDGATRSDGSGSWEMKMLMHGNEYVDTRKGYVALATHGRVALILRVNGSDRMLKMLKHQHFTSHSITTIHSQYKC